MRRPTTRSLTCGMTLVELAVGLLALGTLVLAVSRSLASMRQLTLTGKTETRAQEQARRAADRIVDDLRRAGVVTLGALSYPHAFEGGAPEPGYDAAGLIAHELAPKEAQVGDLDYGDDRELLFVLPADADGDRQPDIDPSTGQLVWDATTEVAYVRVRLSDGTNALERRTSDGSRRIVARGVERVVFETADMVPTPDPPLDLDTVRVRLFLRTRSSDGTVHRSRRDIVVKMRN